MSTATKHIVRAVLERTCVGTIDENDAERLLASPGRDSYTADVWARWGWLLDAEDRRTRAMAAMFYGERLFNDDATAPVTCNVDGCRDEVTHVRYAEPRLYFCARHADEENERMSANRAAHGWP